MFRLRTLVYVLSFEMIGTSSRVGPGGAVVPGDPSFLPLLSTAFPYSFLSLPFFAISASLSSIFLIAASILFSFAKHLLSLPTESLVHVLVYVLMHDI